LKTETAGGAKAATYPVHGPVGPLPVIDNTKTYKGSYALHYATMHSATTDFHVHLPANWGPVLWEGHIFTIYAVRFPCL